MKSFVYESLPGRVVFARGASRSLLAEEVVRLNATRVMVIAAESERSLAEGLIKPFSDRVVGVYSNVKPHVPADVADDARKAAEEYGADALISIGGGSTTGTAKIIALTSGLPILAIPTTYAGSEMTPVWGMTTDARKETGKDMRVLPRTVVYDPDLVETLPRELAVSSALNAMAHCVESLWTPAANPITSMMAIEGAKSLAEGIRATDNQEATSSTLYGAYLAGACFAVAGSGLHHKICHALGGAFNLPHAETHAIVLPQVLKFNQSAAQLGDDMRDLNAALGGTTDSPADALQALYRDAGAPTQLADLGLTEEQRVQAVDIIEDKLPIDNPRPVDRAAIDEILTNAFEG